MDHVFSTGEVAKLLGIQPYRISYAIVSGQIPESSFRFLGKRCFSEADIARIADHFGVEGPWEQGNGNVAEVDSTPDVASSF